MWNKSTLKEKHFGIVAKRITVLRARLEANLFIFKQLKAIKTIQGQAETKNTRQRNYTNSILWSHEGSLANIITILVTSLNSTTHNIRWPIIQWVNSTMNVMIQCSNYLIKTWNKWELNNVKHNGTCQLSTKVKANLLLVREQYLEDKKIFFTRNVSGMV